MAIIQNLEAFVQSYPAGLDSVTDLQLSQNENGRQIRFTIGGVTIPAGSVATISGTKPDGVVYSNTGTIEGADTVIFDEDVQMTAVFGTWYAKIKITNAGNTIASARVRFIIDKDPVDAGAIPSESQLDGLVAEAEEYAEAAGDAAERAAITYGSPLTASTAAAMTDVNRVYVYTGSESGYTYGNWYYYNGSAWVSGGVYNSAAVETDTTLTESGVPADAKATGDKIAELKDDFDNLTNDIVREVIEPEWEQNRVMASDNGLIEVESTVFANSGFITTASDCTIEVTSGYKIFVWACHYNELGHAGLQITNAWTSDTVNYTYNETFPYIIICVQKNPSAVITAEDASNVITIYSKNKSIFALKTDVSDVSEQVTTIENSISDLDSIRNNLSNLSNKVSDALDSEIIVPYTATQGRIIISNNTITLQSANDFCNTGYIDLSILNEVDVTVISGYKICGWTSDNNSFEFVEYAPKALTNGYVTETVNAYADSVRKYAIFSIAKVDGGAITPSEAQNAVSVIYKNDDSLTNAVDSLDTRVSALEESSDNLYTVAVPSKGQILYEADNDSSSGYICNAVAYDDGVIIACRSDGRVVRIGYDGSEETLMTINGSNMDWRLCWIDSNESVYVSPHASYGSMPVADRGLYKLVKGASAFTKVISLYNPSSTVTTETENNDDTIWTMCEDGKGNLYAGVYAHTVRANPAIYKSVDGGNTWTYLFNFKTAGLTSSGMHIHTLIYSEWKDALYCIVGEVNTIFKSTDGAVTWTDLQVTLKFKGSAMCATPYGILIGSDGAYNCEIDILYNDDTTHKTVFSGWANTVFAIRRSDMTGIVYAFTKVDSSVNAEQYFPPLSAITDESALNTWKSGSGHNVTSWTEYYNSIIDQYPNDAIRPQHCAILVSRDGGGCWDVLKKYELGINTSNNTTYIDGFWTTGFFKNGECLTGRFENNAFVNPVVISEGKHKYVSGGCDLEGEIFVRTNQSAIVEVV